MGDAFGFQQLKGGGDFGAGLLGCDDLVDFMEYTGGAFHGIVHPDDAARVRDEIIGQVGLDDVGAKDFIDFRIVAKDGTVKNVSENGRLVDLDGVGKVFYVLIINSDERVHR